MPDNNNCCIRNIIYILGLLYILSIVSCSSVQEAPDCINKSSLNAVLKWGLLENNELTSSQTLTMNGELRVFDKRLTDLKNENEQIYLDKDTICTLMRDLGRLILKHQVLSIPSDYNNFIEYRNDERNYYFRALWDPNFKNDVNVEFIEFYNRLEKLTENYDNINSR